MRLRKHLCGFGFSLALTLGAAAAGAAEPSQAQTPIYGPFYGPAETEAPATDVFEPVPETVADITQCFAPQMIGDFRGVYGNTITPFVTDGGMTFGRIQQPLVGRGAFKIAENESPQPQDRVFLTYNYYNRLPAPASNGLTFLPGGQQFDVPAGNIRVKALDVHQETFGIEKTIGQNFSIGFRLPFFQTAGGDVDFEAPTGQGPLLGGGVIGNDDCGDLTIIGKYALVRTATGLFTVGLAVTVPTGPDFFVTNPNSTLPALLHRTVLPDLFVTQGTSIHSNLLQPYFGILHGCGPIFLHGFTSVVVPTDGRDVTIVFNDYGLGWYLYEGSGGQMLSSIVPTAEVHVATPLNGRDTSDLVFMKDQVVFTGGIHFGLWQNTRMTLGTSVPVTGPQPYDISAVAQFNVRY